MMLCKELMFKKSALKTVCAVDHMTAAYVLSRHLIREVLSPKKTFLVNFIYI
jgi:hypothetical protein